MDLLRKDCYEQDNSYDYDANYFHYVLFSAEIAR